MGTVWDEALAQLLRGPGVGYKGGGGLPLPLSSFSLGCAP